MAGNFSLGMDTILLSSSQSSSLDEEEMVRMETEAVPESTSKATKSGVTKISNWLKKRKMDVNFHTVSAEELATILRRFYAELKKDNGDPLTPSSLVGIRAAINRHLVSAPFYRKMNVVSGDEFVIANKMFDTKCKLYYKGNNPKPKHKPVIEKDDMKKLAEYFQYYYQNPVILSEATWFLLCFHFGRRGREGWAAMTKDFFTVAKNSEGEEFVECCKTETVKNIQGGHKQVDQDYSETRMCGEAVQIFTFFLSKLNPDCDRLFQYPLNSFLVSSNTWYAKKPMGKNTLAQMMPRISEKSGLSKTYTCHSVRASCVSILFQAGVSAEKIISITRHKNTSSLKHYISGMSTDQKQQCSSILSSSIFGQPDARVNSEPACAVNPSPDNSDNSESSAAVKPYNVNDDSVPLLRGVSSSSLNIVAQKEQNGSFCKFSEIFGNCHFNNCEFKLS